MKIKQVFIYVFIFFTGVIFYKLVYNNDLIEGKLTKEKQQQLIKKEKELKADINQKKTTINQLDQQIDILESQKHKLESQTDDDQKQYDQLMHRLSPASSGAATEGRSLG